MPELATVYRHLGNRMRALREARQLTQAQLAEAIGRGSEYISAVERGKKRMQLEDLAKAADALAVSFSELFQGVPIRDPVRSRASDKHSRYEKRNRNAAAPESIATLTHLLALLDDADVNALTLMAQRFIALHHTR